MTLTQQETNELQELENQWERSTRKERQQAVLGRGHQRMTELRNKRQLLARRLSRREPPPDKYLCETEGGRLILARIAEARARKNRG